MENDVTSPKDTVVARSLTNNALRATAAKSTGAPAQEELQHKLTDAVQLIAITNETDNYGVQAGVGPLQLRVYLAGQSTRIYIGTKDYEEGDVIPPHDRVRMLLHAHLTRLKDDFPNLPFILAEGVEHLVDVEIGDYRKQAQRLFRYR